MLFILLVLPFSHAFQQVEQRYPGPTDLSDPNTLGTTASEAAEKTKTSDFEPRVEGLSDPGKQEIAEKQRNSGESGEKPEKAGESEPVGLGLQQETGVSALPEALTDQKTDFTAELAESRLETHQKASESTHPDPNSVNSAGQTLNLQEAEGSLDSKVPLNPVATENEEIHSTSSLNLEAEELKSAQSAVPEPSQGPDKATEVDLKAADADKTGSGESPLKGTQEGSLHIVDLQSPPTLSDREEETDPLPVPANSSPAPAHSPLPDSIKPPLTPTEEAQRKGEGKDSAVSEGEAVPSAPSSVDFEGSSALHIEEPSSNQPASEAVSTDIPVSSSTIEEVAKREGKDIVLREIPSETAQAQTESSSPSPIEPVSQLPELPAPAQTDTNTERGQKMSTDTTISDVNGRSFETVPAEEEVQVLDHGSEELEESRAMHTDEKGQPITEVVHFEESAEENISISEQIKGETLTISTPQTSDIPSSPTQVHTEAPTIPTPQTSDMPSTSPTQVHTETPTIPTPQTSDIPSTSPTQVHTEAPTIPTPQTSDIPSTSPTQVHTETPTIPTPSVSEVPSTPAKEEPVIQSIMPNSKVESGPPTPPSNPPPLTEQQDNSSQNSSQSALSPETLQNPVQSDSKDTESLNLVDPTVTVDPTSIPLNSHLVQENPENTIELTEPKSTFTHPISAESPSLSFDDSTETESFRTIEESLSSSEPSIEVVPTPTEITANGEASPSLSVLEAIPLAVEKAASKSYRSLRGSDTRFVLSFYLILLIGALLACCQPRKTTPKSLSTEFQSFAFPQASPTVQSSLGTLEANLTEMLQAHLECQQEVVDSHTSLCEELRVIAEY